MDGSCWAVSWIFGVMDYLIFINFAPQIRTPREPQMKRGASRRASFGTGLGVSIRGATFNENIGIQHPKNPNSRPTRRAGLVVLQGFVDRVP